MAQDYHDGLAAKQKSDNRSLLFYTQDDKKQREDALPWVSICHASAPGSRLKHGSGGDRTKNTQQDLK
ncbi:hypothetical protein [Marinobacterium rhizophilum]|uniref:hypothetical protein n=1 Tax=Marinobacterium rhizophilum TaxID=420402 RepID=UPI0012EBAC75|nr:hypothetical protein [Marinobacterium rhizophilum]